MFIWLYRRWRKKRREAALAAADPSTVPAKAEKTPEERAHMKELVKYRLVLFVALVLPVFLETLDYTGKDLLFICLWNQTS